MTHDKALVRLNSDLERAHSLEDFDVKLKRLFNIAQQFDALKMRPRAEEVYDQALQVIQAIPSLYKGSLKRRCNEGQLAKGKHQEPPFPGFFHKPSGYQFKPGQQVVQRVAAFE